MAIKNLVTSGLYGSPVGYMLTDGLGFAVAVSAAVAEASGGSDAMRLDEVYLPLRPQQFWMRAEVEVQGLRTRVRVGTPPVYAVRNESFEDEDELILAMVLTGDGG